jgi:hypothetical protein
MRSGWSGRIDDAYAHRHALRDLDPVAGCVLRREQRERRAAASAHALDDTLERPIRVHVDANRHFLPGVNALELGLLEVRIDPEAAAHDDREQRVARRDDGAGGEIEARDPAFFRRTHDGMLEIEPGLLDLRLRDAYRRRRPAARGQRCLRLLDACLPGGERCPRGVHACARVVGRLARHEVLLHELLRAPQVRFGVAEIGGESRRIRLRSEHVGLVLAGTLLRLPQLAFGFRKRSFERPPIELEQDVAAMHVLVLLHGHRDDLAHHEDDTCTIRAFT